MVTFTPATTFFSAIRTSIVGVGSGSGSGSGSPQDTRHENARNQTSKLARRVVNLRILLIDLYGH